MKSSKIFSILCAYFFTKIEIWICSQWTAVLRIARSKLSRRCAFFSVRQAMIRQSRRIFTLTMISFIHRWKFQSEQTTLCVATCGTVANASPLRLPEMHVDEFPEAFLTVTSSDLNSLPIMAFEYICPSCIHYLKTSCRPTIIYFLDNWYSWDLKWHVNIKLHCHLHKHSHTRIHLQTHLRSGILALDDTIH